MFILEWLFPRFCIGCGFLGEYLCLRCINLLKIKQNLCFYCEKPSPSGITHFLCVPRGPITGNLNLYQYGGLMVKIIHSYKYQLNQLIIKRFLSQALQLQASRIKVFLPSTRALLIPVPLGQERIHQRGFNQSLTICHHLSSWLNLQTANVVIKTRKTQPQAGIKNKKYRERNIKGAFKVINSKIINKKDIIIVDDLVTTGATINEIACVLKKAGAGRIYSFALARP